MNPNPITPPTNVKIGDIEYELYFAHRDFATGERLLHQQGIDVWMLGPRSAEFWPGLIEGDEPKEGEEDRPIVLKEFDTFKAECLLFAGLCRKNPKLRFDELQDLITFENQAVLGEVVAAAALAIMPIRKEEPAEVKEAETEAPPLPSVNGGLTAGPSPEETSGSPSESSGG
jgi:hypothetical protein